jgi:hypothetical protein
MKARKLRLRNFDNFKYVYLPKNHIWRINESRKTTEYSGLGRSSWIEHNYLSVNYMNDLSWQNISKEKARELYPKLFAV